MEIFIIHTANTTVHKAIIHSSKYQENIQLGNPSGSVAEWSKALVLGTSLIEAWVRIPPLPKILHKISV